MRIALPAALVLAALLAAPAPALAQEPPQIVNAWMRPAVPGSTVDAYADIRTGVPLVLTGVKTASAARVDIVLMDPPGSGDLKVVPELALPAGQTRFALKGSVLRLVEVQAPLGNGDPVTLRFEFRDAAGRRSSVDAPVTVRGFAPAPPPPPIPPAPTS